MGSGTRRASGARGADEGEAAFERLKQIAIAPEGYGDLVEARVLHGGGLTIVPLSEGGAPLEDKRIILDPAQATDLSDMISPVIVLRRGAAPLTEADVNGAIGLAFIIGGALGLFSGTILAYLFL